MRLRKTGHVMTPDVVSVRAETPFRDIAALLGRYRVSGMPVVDDDDKVLGVVSETDLTARQAEPQGSARQQSARSGAAGLHDRTAGQLMSAPAVTVRATDAVAVAARALAEHKVNRLPVVDEEDRLVGIVTRGDLLQMFLRPDADIRAEVVDEVAIRALWLGPDALAVSVQGGVVILEGRLERRSEIPLAEGLTRRIDGVVAVVNRLTYRLDDTQRRSVAPHVHEIAEGSLRS
ncbi:CBS domain-containing protein [Streptomyces sp. MI02-7b]|uniref:CBS domain-containing protein n=1 Tax=Streptomyces sp. MI02-7b TaxID=462941 RepID=UPI0029B9DF9A|nr:CBS domain-containing protein [Streptomyces sp. MI02-7b]MDX3077786.1 CBS domain-containing protein [Streptomyces sp. MI02-7b]